MANLTHFFDLMFGRHHTKIVNVYRKDPKNIGDKYSTPALYFDFLKDVKKVNVLDRHIKEIVRDKVVVVGGGGLLYFDDYMKMIVSAGARAIIGWGIGHNTHNSKTIELPDYLRSYNAIGIRDYGYGYEWVPCASCMHSAFDKTYSVKHDVIVYNHRSFPIPISSCFPTLPNSEKNFGKVIEFLGSGAVILTNTYHGAYWGTLLKRKVIIINPFSSKFFGFKHKLPISDAQGWQAAVNDATIYPEALAECRDANLKFAEKVRDIITKYTTA